jgi:phytoene synthase
VAARARASDLSAAYAHCEAVARGHYENFPVASVLLPRALRPHVSAMYAFARAADDFADEAAPPEGRLAALAEWERRLDRCLEGDADHPVFIAVGDTIRKFRIPDVLLRDLLSAFRQDCTTRRYVRWEDLLDYSRRSANPVGRIVLRLFGYADAVRDARSDAICTALQFTNFWQDVGVDLAKDRIYLPAVEMAYYGVTEADLRGGVVHEGTKRLLAEMSRRTRLLFEEGRQLPDLVGGRLAKEVRWIWLGGNRILDRIEAVGYDVFRHRPTLSPWDHGSLAFRALLVPRALAR